MKKDKLLLILLLFASIFYGQEVNFGKLKNEIDQYNREGNHQISQRKLLEILHRNDLSTKDEIKLNLLVTSTFRSIGDYGAAISQLQKAKYLSRKLDDGDSLKMNIDAEMAFVYFDDNNYQESEKIIKKKYTLKISHF